jgi:hypothetical protein
VLVVVKAGPALDPFSFWCRYRWSNLCCDGWFHCRGTCSIEVLVCMGLGLSRGHGSKLHLASYFEEIFGRNFYNLPFAEVLQKFYSSSVMVRHPQNRCYVLASDNCVGCYRSEFLLLRLGLLLSVATRACESAESRIC